VFSRFDDCQRVLADGETFLVIDGAWRDEHTPGWRDTPAAALLAELLPWKNPPAHTRERRLLARDFTVRRVHLLEPAVRHAVDRVLDRFEERGSGEFVGTVLYPLSMAVIGDLVGVPESDHAELRRVTDLFSKQVGPELAPELRDEVDAAALAYRDYFTELIALRRKEPRDDLTSALIGKHEADPEQMSEDDVLASLIVLFGAGYETTAGTLGNGLYAPPRRSCAGTVPRRSASARPRRTRRSGTRRSPPGTASSSSTVRRTGTRRASPIRTPSPSPATRAVASSSGTACISA
jgi:cytochrome P450